MDTSVSFFSRFMRPAEVLEEIQRELFLSAIRRSRKDRRRNRPAPFVRRQPDRRQVFRAVFLQQWLNPYFWKDGRKVVFLESGRFSQWKSFFTVSCPQNLPSIGGKFCNKQFRPYAGKIFREIAVATSIFRSSTFFFLISSHVIEEFFDNSYLQKPRYLTSTRLTIYSYSFKSDFVIVLYSPSCVETDRDL